MKDRDTYIHRFLVILQPPSIDGVSDVERVIVSKVARIFSPLYHKCVRAASPHDQLRDEHVLNIPWDPPSNLP